MQVIDLTVPMYEAPEWFEGVKMNFAENLLRFRDDNVALIVAGKQNIVHIKMYFQYNSLNEKITF